MFEQMSLPAVARSACNADPCHPYSTALQVALLWMHALRWYWLESSSPSMT